MTFCDHPEHGGPSRRELLQTFACGFGWLAFRGLAGDDLPQDANDDPLAPKQPHFAPRAKRVIFLCMAGGPSHVDTFDYKPKLVADDGKAMAGRRAGARLLGSPWKFSQHGRSGLWISELFPELAAHADSLCLLRGMTTELPAHPQAFLKLHTGSFQFVRPSFGSWALYGLGTGNRNLPGFVTLNAPTAQGGAQNYGSAFLPAIYQGTRIGVSGRGGGGGPFARRGGAAGSSLPNIKNPKLDDKEQRAQLDLLQKLNKERQRKDRDDPGVEGVIESYELAFRMQSEVPGLLDLSKEPRAVQEAYGIGGDDTDGFGRQCLLARRLVESGVRFVEVSQGGWDHHRNLKQDLARSCGAIDKPIAALLADLSRRGMLKDTLVIWGGEFGRTPYAQGDDGRDHNNKGFTMWMAGGGVRGGTSYGATDDYGAEAVEGRMDLHDLHATALHLLGLDHTKLTYQYAGRDFRLTETAGNVIKEVVA
jgi:Protein of unknown function (DUF1501)